MLVFFLVNLFLRAVGNDSSCYVTLLISSLSACPEATITDLVPETHQFLVLSRAMKIHGIWRKRGEWKLVGFPTQKMDEPI